MKKVLFLTSLSFGFAATLMAGDTFYWKADRRQWADYSDPANWSLEKDSYSNPDSRIPTSSDSLWYFGVVSSGDYGNYLGYFDLKGGSYTIAGYSYGSGVGTVWKSYQIHLTNGTFTVLDPESHPDSGGSARNTRGYHVWDSAKLVFPAGGQAIIGVSGLEEQFSIKKGGMMEWYKGVLLYSMAASIENGGEMVFDPEVFDVHAAAQNTTQGHYCRMTNRGILRLPHGLVWAGSTTANNQGKSFVLSQSTGTLYIGGDFTKTTESNSRAACLRFTFSGGTIVATNSVAFRNATVNWEQEVFPSMPNNASGTVEVCADSVLDMQLFEYGTGTSLVKTGPGTLVVAASRPTSLNVTAGTLRTGAAMDCLSGITLAAGVCIEFAAPNNDFPTPANYSSLDFAIDVTSSAIQSGRTIFSSSDADFLAYVKSHVTAHLPLGYRIRQNGTELVLVQVPAVPTFESEGELDLSNAAGWGGALPATGVDVAVSGPDTVAIVSATPAYSSITIYDGATVKVTGTDIDLPAVTLACPSKLLVAGGATAYITNGVTGGGDEFGLPVFEIATNATVTAARSTRFKNMDFRLYGKIEVPQTGSGGLTFGYAAAGETAYFAMTSVGGKMLIPLNTGLSSAWKNFIYPATGGRVVVRGPIVLKDTEFINTFIRASDNRTVSIYNGLWIGVNNPSDEPFEVIIDNTAAPIDKYAAIRGAATVRCINGGRLYRTTDHPGVATKGEIKEAGRVIIEGKGCGMSYSHVGIQDDIQHSPFMFSPDADGFESIVLGDWATMALHESGGNGKAVLAASNGVWQIPTLPYVSKDVAQPANGDPRDWMTDVLAGLKAVRIAEGTEFRLESAEVLGGTAWNRDVKLADVPMTGAGDLVMTNGTPGYTFRATVVSANNTATGAAKAFCGTGGDATTLLFNDGANWAGTVVAGNVALTNVADGAAAATVNFGSLRLDGDFPVRVWATTNDMVNISSQLLAGDGAFAPIAMPGRGAFMPCESFKLGTYPANTAFPSKVGNWKITASATGDPDLVALTLTYMPPGTVLLFR